MMKTTHRQNLSRAIATVALIAAGMAVTLFAEEPAAVTSDDALKRLLDGNAKFVAGKSNAARGQDLVARRKAVAKDQKPFAVIVSCSDSRVPPELTFDVGLGDIFVVRTAGEVVDAVAMGSIEYAVEHLGDTFDRCARTSTMRCGLGCGCRSERAREYSGCIESNLACG